MISAVNEFPGVGIGWCYSYQRLTCCVVSPVCHALEGPLLEVISTAKGCISHENHLLEHISTIVGISDTGKWHIQLT